MTAVEKLASLDEEDRLAKSYETLGEVTGRRAFQALDPYSTIAQMLAIEVPTVCSAGFTLGSGEALRDHKIEIRLRDDQLGKIVGGMRTATFASPTK
jgi:hypothetical protein